MFYKICNQCGVSPKDTQGVCSKKKAGQKVSVSSASVGDYVKILIVDEFGNNGWSNPIPLNTSKGWFGGGMQFVIPVDLKLA